MVLVYDPNSTEFLDHPVEELDPATTVNILEDKGEKTEGRYVLPFINLGDITQSFFLFDIYLQYIATCPLMCFLEPRV